MSLKSDILRLQKTIRENWRAATSIAGASLIHFTLGSFYTFGNMSPYISSYLRFKTENGWVTSGHTVWIFAVVLIFTGVLMAIGGVIESRIGARATCLIGCWVISASFVLTYYSIKANLWAVIVSYGILPGMGAGITYSVAMNTAMKWYPNNRGVVTGIVAAGFCLGTFIFNIFQTRFINPLNISPVLVNHTDIVSNITKLNKEKYFVDERVLAQVPLFFVILGVILSIIQLIGVVMLIETDPIEKPDKEDITEDPKMKKDADSDKPNEKMDEKLSLLTQEESDNMDYTLLEALKNNMFWLLFVIYFSNGFFVVVIVAQYKAFGQQFINDDHYFAILGSVGSICNCVARVLWGQLYDVFGYRITFSVLTVLRVLVMGTIYFCSFIKNQIIAKSFYFIWVSLLFLSRGSAVIIPSVVSNYYGYTNFSQIYGVMFLAPSIASIFEALVSSLFSYAMQYKGQFIIATLSSLFSLLLTQFFRTRGDTVRNKT